VDASGQGAVAHQLSSREDVELDGRIVRDAAFFVE